MRFGGKDCDARQWEKKEGVWKMLGVLQGDTRSVPSLAISTKSGLVVSGSSDCDARLWKEYSGLWKTVSVLEGNRSTETHVTI